MRLGAVKCDFVFIYLFIYFYIEVGILWICEDADALLVLELFENKDFRPTFFWWDGVLPFLVTSLFGKLVNRHNLSANNDLF